MGIWSACMSEDHMHAVPTENSKKALTGFPGTGASYFYELPVVWVLGIKSGTWELNPGPGYVQSVLESTELFVQTLVTITYGSPVQYE